MSLSEESLAKVFARKQVENNYPGLMREIYDMLAETCLANSNPNDYNKLQWKKIIKSENKQCHLHLLEKM